MSNPSPVCEVKNGAAAYVVTTGGVDITPGATIIIRLSSQSDVDAWLIECATTDDTQDADTITASLSIDTDARTATFTAPATEGTALRFRSRVNGGIDRNGVAQSSYETTFCLYTLVSNRRVIAADETTEGDATFGWIKWLNDMIRNFGGDGGGGGSQAVGVNYQFQFYSGGSQLGATGLDYNPTTMQAIGRFSTASIVNAQIGNATIGTGYIAAGVIATATLPNARLVGQATLTSANLSNVVMNNGTIVAAMIGGAATAATGMRLMAPWLERAVLAGTAVFTGTDMTAEGLADHKPFSVVRTITTSDATVKNAFAWKILDEAITSVVAEVNAIPSGGSAGGSYCRRVMIRSDGGTATCGTVENSWNDEHTASGPGFTGLSVGSGIYIGASGATGFVNVIGSATGAIKWGVTVTVQPTRWA